MNLKKSENAFPSIMTTNLKKSENAFPSIMTTNKRNFGDSEDANMVSKIKRFKSDPSSSVICPKPAVFSPNACLLLTLTPGSNSNTSEPISAHCERKLAKRSKKLFRSVGIKTTSIAVAHGNQSFVMAHFTTPVDENARKQFEASLQQKIYQGSAVLWAYRDEIEKFTKAMSPSPLHIVEIDKQKKNTTKSSKDKPSEVDEPSYKTNDNIRGKATCLLLKNLPQTVQYPQLRANLPFRFKTLQLFKKSGKRTALVSFHTIEDCSSAFDALQNFIYDGLKISVALILPRAKTIKESSEAVQQILSSSVQKPCLDITNIPFAATLEHLKEAFPTAENIVIRRRKDGKSKGSAILVFENADDSETVLQACRNKFVEGRQIVCNVASPDSLDLLKLEFAPKPPRARKEALEGCQLKIFNLPYSTTEDELKKTFPRSRHIFITKAEGSPGGIALITFKTPGICKAEISRAANLTLQGRKLRAELNVTQKKSKSKWDKKKKNKVQHVGGEGILNLVPDDDNQEEDK